VEKHLTVNNIVSICFFIVIEEGRSDEAALFISWL